VLMEGKFNSNYENRIIDPKIAENKDFDIKYTSPETMMAFFSDGDLIRNQVIQQSNGPFPLPLGFDRYTQKMFDNKKFLLSTINYMLGDYNLIKLRSKELKIRLLDKNKVAKEKLKWQLINTILPIILILLIGISAGIIKKYKFTRK
jgi:ABC-2 type transport system permease protein